MVSEGSILLADDEEIFLEATQDLLKEEGYDCHGVRNAEELSEALHSFEFDLLITDLNMPGNRVLGMVDEIRRQSSMLPVIVVTGYPSVPSAVESIRLNVLEYMIKPVVFQTLLEAVKRGLQQNEVLRRVRKAKQEAELRTQYLSNMEQTLGVFGNVVQTAEVEQALVTDPHVKELRRQVESLSHIIEHEEKVFHVPSPDYFRLREALYETVQVLQQTKSAFRSKDLANLRLKLQALLKDTDPGNPKDSTISHR